MNEVECLLKELMRDRVSYRYTKKHFSSNDYVAVLITPPYITNRPIIINTKMAFIVDITDNGVVFDHLGLLKYDCIFDILKFEH